MMRRMRRPSSAVAKLLAGQAWQTWREVVSHSGPGFTEPVDGLQGQLRVF